MIAQVPLHPNRLVLYGSVRLIDDDGTVLRSFGVDFNRAMLYHRPLFYWQAAIFRRDIVALGCRFDEALPVSEDRDFLAQISLHSDFAFVPVLATNYGLTTGTSGTTVGANFKPTLHIPCESRLAAKWGGENAHHLRRATRLAQCAVEAFFAGHVYEARDLLDRLLSQYPDDPNALNGLARIALHQGDAASALRRARRAVDVNPTVAEYQLTLAEALRAEGQPDEARDHALLVTTDPNLGTMAQMLIQSLPKSNAASTPARAFDASRSTAANAKPNSASPSRLSLCHCGSQLRYKDCCGRIGGKPIPHVPESAQIERVKALFAGGDAEAALDELALIVVAEMRDVPSALAAGRIYFELGALARSRECAERALDLRVDNGDAAALLQRCTAMQCAPIYASSAYRMVASLCERIRARPVRAEASDRDLHVLATLGTLGGSERHATNLVRVLSRHMKVQLWSTTPPHACFAERGDVRVIDAASGHFPRSGTLVVMGQYFDIGNWLLDTRFRKIVLRYNIELPQHLVNQVTDIELCGYGTDIQFTYPSALFAARVGLQGRVEHCLPDTTHFKPTPRDAGVLLGEQRRLVVGRHSRDDASKHHPNDLAMYRRIVGAGHRIRLQGASGIALQMRSSQSVAHRALDAAIDVQPFAHEDAATFLRRIDCFVYRIHPNWFETGGNVVHEAMAMGLAVIVIGDRVGASELIRHGVNGYHATTEDETLKIIEALSMDGVLRARIGSNARATILAAETQQARALREFYDDVVTTGALREPESSVEGD